MRREGVVAVLVLIVIILIVGFNVVLASNNEMPKDTKENSVVKDKKVENQEDIFKQINEADKVEIYEEIITFNKEYSIYINNEKVATVSGEYINITGDVFTLEDKYGNDLASEKQIKRWGIKLNRLAEVRDKNGKIEGYIGEDVIEDFFSASKYKFHFYDKNKNEYAYTKENVLSLLYEFEVYNMQDVQIYKVEQDFDITDSYTITKERESDVAMYEVIFLTCIIDAIKDAE